jgi:predicted oxidoreductase
MTWPDTSAVTKVVLSKRGADLEAKAFGVDGKTVVQVWYAGQVCATCGGGLGPTGKLRPCNRPLKPSCP